ncbi:hypothetical protein K7432_012426 [Basidiobolus ranarum]|uniref:Uncharacterized protein n=1 Tax=Basidiobolus ranarum TaxID=34480 RepID=A0ABR2VSP8_9FUNG
MNPFSIKSEKPMHVENSLLPDVWSESPPSSPSSSSTSGDIRPKISSKPFESPIVCSKPKITPLYLFPASSLASDLISSSRVTNRANLSSGPSYDYSSLEENFNTTADFDISNLDMLPSCLSDLSASWDSSIHGQTMPSPDRRHSMDSTTQLSTGVWDGFKSPEFLHVQDAHMENALLLTCSYTPSSNIEQLGSAIIETTTTQDTLIHYVFIYAYMTLNGPIIAINVANTLTESMIYNVIR